MINIKSKEECCGCSACAQRCPKQCIKMLEDEEGFLYPKVDETKCINCHLCEKVCPVANQAESRMPIDSYAAYNVDDGVRKDSSSGGIFTLLAEKVIAEGGAVFGATWNEKWQVVHTYTETKEGIAQFRGSKYIQSIIGETYKQAETFLKSGRKVLYSGTPCQIAGLRLFLRKEYDNLLTIDFICHGVPSPGVFRWYLQEEITNYATRKGRKNTVSFLPIHSIPEGDVLMPEGLSIKGIRFRDKCSGWKKFSFVLLLAEASAEGKQNSVSLSYTLEQNSFLKGFLNDLYLRPSCHKCPAKSLKSGSDITIADYWGYKDTPNITDTDEGISAVLINTVKGQAEFEMLSLIKEKTTYDLIERTNGAINHSASNYYRGLFYKKSNQSFHSRIDHIVSHRFFDKIRRKIYLYIGI